MSLGDACRDMLKMSPFMHRNANNAAVTDKRELTGDKRMPIVAKRMGDLRNGAPEGDNSKPPWSVSSKIPCFPPY